MRLSFADLLTKKGRKLIQTIFAFREIFTCVFDEVSSKTCPASSGYKNAPI